MNTRERALRQRHWLISLWPLALFLLLAVIAGQMMAHYWPRILMESIVFQKQLHQQMAGLLQQVKAEPRSAGLSLVAFSLVYGVLHAVGPGHGKIVITTYLATHPSRLKSSLKLTLLASLLQGVVAIVLVTLMLQIFKLSSRQLHQSSFWLERGSFIIVMLLGGMLCWRALRRGYRIWQKHQNPTAVTIHRISTLPDHQHHAHCGCGHQHMPSDEQLQAGADWRMQMAVVLAMGLRPCSGAILVLLFSKVIGVFGWGILSALAMAAGTSLTISLIGVLVHYSRSLAVRLSAPRAPALWSSLSWSLLAFVGGAILIAVGYLLYSSGSTEMIGGIRPFAR